MSWAVMFMAPTIMPDWSVTSGDYSREDGD